MIYAIGDSHIKGLSSIATLCQVDAATAYGLLSADSATQSREKVLEFLKDVPKGSWLVVSFGEVDCRCHINKFNDIIKATKTAIDRYFTFIDSLNKYKVVIFCPVPPLRRRISTKQLIALKNYKDGMYSLAGSYNDRLLATLCFNTNIEIEAKKRGIPIVNVFDKVFNDGNCYLEWIHLNDEGYKFVIDEVKRICK